MGHMAPSKTINATTFITKANFSSQLFCAQLKLKCDRI